MLICRCRSLDASRVTIILLFQEGKMEKEVEVGMGVEWEWECN